MSRQTWTPMRALGSREEFADAVSRLADSYRRPLPADDPLAPLASDVALALTEAGCTYSNLLL
jgi:hypothetical protein